MKSSSVDIIYHKIVEYILQGEIKPGEKIVQLDFAKKLGASITPVREALRRLQSDGLITVEPQRGATLKKLSIEEVEEIYSIRVKLEGLAVELTINNLDDAKIENLVEFRRKFRSSLEHKDNLRWLNDNTDFHSYFAEFCKNATLCQMIRNLYIKVNKYKYVALMHPNWITEYSLQHEEIINAAIDKNSKDAGKLMEIHLDTVKENLMGYLKSFPFY